MKDYKTITVEDIVKYINKNSKLFPKGMKTPIFSGDFECNYTHGKHIVQHMNKDEHIKENVICLGYEMHENVYPW